MKIGPKLLAAPLLTAVVALASGALYGVLTQRDAAQIHHAVVRDAGQFKALAQAQ